MFIVTLRHAARVSTIIIAAFLFVQSDPAHACSSCGCTLNSDWSSQGYSVASGFKLDVRQDYYDQQQLRSDRHVVERQSLELPNEQEVQLNTINRNTIVGLDYSPSRNWGVHVGLPYFNRFHTTIGEGDDETSTSHTEGAGDIRLVAHYEGFSPDLSWGVEFGLKLPTGNSDEKFISGPLTGEQIDRGLQLGTGTTDLVVGVYHFGNVTARLGYFIQATAQTALNSHNDFKPGNALSFNAGIRYLHSGRWSPQLQINTRIEGRESGINSDRENSGATSIYASPGTTLQATASLQLYAFIQMPIYQRVNGLQLQPVRFYSMGGQYKF